MKIGLLILLQLAFAGQAVASTLVHCPMMLQDTPSKNDNPHQQMDHSKMGHDMTEITMVSDSNMNCCSLTGDCEDGNCFSLTMISESVSISDHSFLYKVFSLPEKQAFRLHNNLFRPPIFA